MKNFIILCVLAVTFLLISIPDAFACSCAAPSPTTTLEQRVAAARKQYQAIFAGKVLEIKEKTGSYVVKVKFKIDKLWKGDLPETITILTGRGGGDCGYPFSVGETYLVYAHGSDESDFLGVGICSRTARIKAAADDLKILGKGEAPGKKKGLRKKTALGLNN